MRRRLARLLLPLALVSACTSAPEQHTLASLREVEPDLAPLEAGDSLDQAIHGYRKFLEEAPVSELTPEAMRRLADLKLEQEYGALGAKLPPPVLAAAPVEAAPRATPAPPELSPLESDAEFEARATRAEILAAREGAASDALGPAAGPLAAIALYDEILAKYPNYAQSDQVLYQKARAFDELGRVDEAIEVIETLIARHPESLHADEVQFRRAEYFFTRRRWREAESAYASITRKGAGSEYFEPALYKLGWSLYKQDLLEEALDEYVRLLDHKVRGGYDFDQSADGDAERRVADTLRVISLSFSNLGGPPSVSTYFSANGERSYEDRVYAQLGEFYLEKLRYDDAAKSYKAFVALHPLHASSPHFGMRVIEIYEKGEFPKLVLEAKKEFAASYGLTAEYWRHFDVTAAPEVITYLKRNLSDLAGHHHALFQAPEQAAQRAENLAEAERWYRAYLASFPSDAESAGVNQRLADLLLEHRDFAAAAREYERAAYEYPAHERAAAAGYAAIYAHREGEKVAEGAEREAAQREAVRSTLRFVDAFPAHEQAALVLGAAVDDLYDTKQFALAIANGRRLIDAYPEAEAPIRRSAWIAVAHSAFELEDFVQAERAYQEVLGLTQADDASRAGFADNLAAAIYKQGERANSAGDARAAADHFLRVAAAAPSSSIRPAAEYDAAAALVALEDWAGAAAVLQNFREAHPEHELARGATQQLAFVYRKQGDAASAAVEYARVAAEAETPALRAEAMLLVGELYESAQLAERAIAAYLAYADAFPEPAETAAETRAKVAALYDAAGERDAQRAQLRALVALDAAARGDARTPRVRTLAARAALVLAEDLTRALAEVRLVQPLEQNLKEKQRRMDATLSALAALVDYEVADVTAAATFHTAESFAEFARALNESERPADLSARERSEYEAGLEQEAFTFEENAISVHEKNLELIRVGVWNAWIEKSLEQLATVVPGRYARREQSSGVLDGIERYAYRSPVAEHQSADVAGAAPRDPATDPVASAEAAPDLAPRLVTPAENPESAPAENADEDFLLPVEEFGPSEANDAQTL